MFALSVPAGVWIGLILTPFTIAVGQILFKMASGSVEKFDHMAVLSLMKNPIFMLAVAIYATATVLWVFVLRSVPLSVAYSFMGITYLAVPVLSAVFLGEAMNWRIYVGAGIIITGVLVANS